jgi:metal-responsive CopG/Arc/MetJ family transcriptional regulator
MLRVTVVLCMGEQKQKWHTIGLPAALFSRVRDVIKWTGHMSISEYARFAVQERLKHDEAQAEEEKMLREED